MIFVGNSKEKYGINEAIEKAGGFGKFQWTYVGIAGANFLPSGFLIYTLNLLTLPQVYLCPDSEGVEHKCKALSEICIDGVLRSDIRLDFSDDRTLLNWVTQMGIQ